MIGELAGLVAEHPYREPVWAELMTAYYLAQRQSDAVDANERLKTILADDLGIDPNPALREPPSTDPAARAVGRYAVGQDDRRRHHDRHGPPHRVWLHLDCRTATRRFRPVPSGDGGGYVINDAGSANGIELKHKRIRGSAPHTDGDHIRIGDSEFIFETQAHEDEQVAGG